jgi:hypothetical protein
MALMTLPAPAGNDEYIVDDQDGETGERLVEVAQKELPGGESDNEDNDDDLDGGQDSFHYFLF